jgi:hypothetical protein
MNASKLAKIFAIVPLGLFIAGCDVGQPPPEEKVSAVICDGSPYWCIEARSEMDAHRPAFVFVDGEEKGLILPGRTSRLPVKAGEMHQVNFCAYFDVAETKQWKCSTPTETKLDSGNSILVVFPLQ